MCLDDLPSTIYSSSLLFADGTKLFRPITDDNSYSFQQLQDDILTFEQWSKLWQLNFNTKKSFIMHLGSNKSILCTTLVVTNFNHLTSIRTLIGVLVDSNLKFHSHTSVVANKANQVLSLIMKYFTNLNEHTLPLLYKSLVKPHLEYANVVWGSSLVIS